MSNIKRSARVLLIAYACRPGESSERQVGWHWANLINCHHNVTVLTRRTHRPFVEAYLARLEPEKPRPEFLYFDLPSWASQFKKGERGLFVYYALWNFFAIMKMRRLNRDGRWEITHFLTFGTLLWPQFSFLMNTGYVLGPVGGGECIPLSLRESFSWRGQVKILFRRFVQKMFFMNPLYLANLAKADKIFARTKETFEMIPERYHTKTELLLETGISTVPPIITAPFRNNSSLEIVSVGRLITSKFNPLMLETLVAFKSKWGKPFCMTVIGDGPERHSLEALRDKLGLEEVVFVGKKSTDEVFKHLLRSDIYFSTTMKEGGSWAFFEAIMCHLPIVCLKVNGPDMIVGADCGIKVRPISYEYTRDTFVNGLLQLAEDSKLRASYASNALDFIKKSYSWRRAAERIDLAYETLLIPIKGDR